MTTETYGACTIKTRRTKDEVAAVRTAITQILKADHPQTVRQVFYQLVARAVIDKTEAEYQRTVIRLLSEMRLSDQISWDWIVDESRRTHDTQTFDNVADALEDTARTYRRSALRESDVYIEIWPEKEALAGIIWDAASDYDVPVVVSKGMPSLTQVYGSYVNIHNAANAGKKSFIYQFGDHDPTGCLIHRSLKRQIEEFCKKYKCRILPTIERAAPTEEQVQAYRLPTRPTKRENNPHARDFEGDSVELDALRSSELRRLVRECIERHIHPHQVEILRAAEDSERELINMFADDVRCGDYDEDDADQDEDDDDEERS